jgi:hypothetical protein
MLAVRNMPCADALLFWVVLQLLCDWRKLKPIILGHRMMPGLLEVRISGVLAGTRRAVRSMLPTVVWMVCVVLCKCGELGVLR